MDQTMVLVLAAIVVLALVVVWWVARHRRSTQLKSRFGSEYQREVERTGNVTEAEAALAARERRVSRLQIHQLSAEDATRFGRAWKSVQTRFVDDPKGAVTDADHLVGEVMLARGYPIGDFEQQVADISVDHPDVVMNYRAARDIAAEHARGRASTEDLRQAMVHYRALFRDLLETPVTVDLPHEHEHARRAQ
jgi:hypothetical protein